ncbi:hypothetical protein KUTeg_007239 [Tegillarca granosa]|uniref:Uncharacterized protein n=1 Tax=Tegillarca granosa TaxID=220873 RepID=A0ABQ9FCP2_TEGGR|nr:hypothetical protein KUTeg_007239 [Tegillarca granosa]
MMKRLAKQLADSRNRCCELEIRVKDVQSETTYKKKTVAESEQDISISDILSAITNETSCLKLKNDEIQSQCSEKDVCLGMLDTENKNLIQRVRNLEQTVTSVQDCNREYLTNLEEKDLLISKLEESMSTMDMSYQDSEKHLVDKDSDIQNLQSQITRLKDNLHWQGNEMNNLQMLYNSQCEQSEDMLRELEECKDNNKRKLEEKDQLMADLQDKYQSLMNSCQNSETQLEENKTLVTELKSIIQELENSNEDKNVMIKDLKMELDNLRDTLAHQVSKTEEIQTLYTTQLEKQDEIMKSVEEFNEANQQKLQDKENDITNLLHQLSVKTSALDEAEEAIRNYQASLAESTEKSQNLQEQLVNNRELLKALEESNATNLKIVEEHENTLSQFEIEKTELNDSLKQVQSLNDSLKEQLEEKD